MRDDAAVTIVEPYAVVARNIDPHADNRIHDDDVAQRFGFTGALVPGVEVFAYATSPLVAAWGPAFFTGGQVDLRFRRPVYDDERVVVEVFPYTEAAVVTPDQLDEDFEEPEPDEVLLVRMPPGLARAFVARSESVLGAGRPTCPFCGNPIDPDGHLCVRANGFRRRDPV